MNNSNDTLKEDRKRRENFFKYMQIIAPTWTFLVGKDNEVKVGDTLKIEELGKEEIEVKVFSVNQEQKGLRIVAQKIINKDNYSFFGDK